MTDTWVSDIRPVDSAEPGWAGQGRFRVSEAGCVDGARMGDDGSARTVEGPKKWVLRTRWGVVYSRTVGSSSEARAYVTVEFQVRIALPGSCSYLSGRNVGHFHTRP